MAKCPPSGTGLSPQARGNHAQFAKQAVLHGSIPAGAGEPCPIRQASRPARVYPRRRGGTTYSTGLAGVESGLSPQARGNLRSSGPSGSWPGSIPAGAGEPQAPLPAGGFARVYPRRRGGTVAKRSPPIASMGLSPQARGNLSHDLTVRITLGSIPAGAGEPLRPPLAAMEQWVYPRRRGGTVLELHGLVSSVGLSPQARGNQEQRNGCIVCDGSIPAGAGEPCSEWPSFQSFWVYPRRRGGTVEVPW